MDSNLKSMFGKSSKGYDSYTKYAYTLKREKEAWKKLYKDVLGTTSGKILNIGCGPGSEAMVVAEMGFDVVAADFSPEMVRLTKENFEIANLKAEVVEADAENLPFDDNTFDFIISNYMMWAVPHPQKVMSEWRRVLKPGGRVAYIDGIWTTKDYSKLRKIWVKKAMKMRNKHNNSHRDDQPLNDAEKGALANLWSKTADRPNDDLAMMENAGFINIKIINKVDRRIFKGKRYIEYGYHKVHYLIYADKSNNPGD